MNSKHYTIVFAVILVLCIFAFPAKSVAPELQITSPKPNAVVAGEVIVLSGVGADPAGTLEVEVLTNDWYVQDGKARIDQDGSWSFSPVHLAGKGAYNNHTVRVTIIRNGTRGKSFTVSGIVRR